MADAPPITAQSADGVLHQFPAGTDAGVIDSVMKTYAEALTPKAAPPPEAPSGTGLGMAKAAGQELAAVPGGLINTYGNLVSGAATASRAYQERPRNDLIEQVKIADMVDRGVKISTRHTDEENTVALAGAGLKFARTYAALPEEDRAAMRKGLDDQLAAMPKFEDTLPGQITTGIQKQLGPAISAVGKSGIKAAQTAFPLTPEEEGRSSVIFTKLLTGLAPYLATGAAAGLPAVVGYMGAESFGKTYDEAKAKGFSDEDATGAAAISGLVQGGLGAVPIGQAMHTMAMVPKAFRGEFIKTAANAVASGGALLTFSQVAAIADNAIAKDSYDPNRSLMQGVGEHMGLTFAAGAALPLAGAAVGRAMRAVTPSPKILDAPTVDQAIDAAKTAVSEPVAEGPPAPVDVDATIANAGDYGRVSEPQAELLKLGRSQGPVFQTPDGAYHFRDPDGDMIPLRTWNEHAPKVEGQTTISPELAAAQRETYGKMGLRVVYFDDVPGTPDGAFVPSNPDVIYLSNRPQRNEALVGAHEATHAMESVPVAPGVTLGDILRGQVAEGLTGEGLRHAYETFGQTAPERRAFPEGPQGDAAHVDAVYRHLYTEMGAEAGGEAPKFPTFIPKVIDEVQARYGFDTAKAVLKKLVDNIQQAMGRLRAFFASPEGPTNTTASQNYFSNLDALHGTLAKMYAERFGTQAEKENAALLTMRNKAERDRFLTSEEQPPTAPPGFFDREPAPAAAPAEPTSTETIQPNSVRAAPEAPGTITPPAQRAAVAETQGRITTLRRWLGELDTQRREEAPASPQATALRQTEADILSKVRGVEARLTGAQAERLGMVRQRLDALLNPVGDSPDMARVREAIVAEQKRLADAAAVGTGLPPFRERGAPRAAAEERSRIRAVMPEERPAEPVQPVEPERPVEPPEPAAPQPAPAEPAPAPVPDRTAQIQREQAAVEAMRAKARGEEVPARPAAAEPAPTPPPRVLPNGHVEIGRNHLGQTLYEDKRGVRSIVERGVYVTEPVGIRPGSSEVRVDRTNRPEYQLAEPHPARPDLKAEYTPAPEARPETSPERIAEATHNPADHRFAEELADLLERGYQVPPRALQETADRLYGGTLASGAYSRDRLYDAIELGVNRYIQRHPERFNPAANADGAKRAANELERLKDSLPTQTVRAGEKDAYQQFSTPPDYAYAANWIANLRASDHVLEPSAGVGGLIVHAMNAGVRETTVNELSDKRRGMIEALKPTRTTGEDAAQLHNILPGDVRPTVVVMNPPFSRSAERMGSRMVLDEGAKHIEQALARLEPGGRLVAIVGDGMKPEGTAPEGTGRGGTGRAFRDWWNKIGAIYDVRANVGVDRDIYKKYGTSFPTRFLVIDKNAPSGRPMVTGQARDAADLIDRLQEVRNERGTVEPVAGQPGRAPVAAGGENVPAGERELPRPTGSVGTGEERGERPAPDVTEPAGAAQPAVGGGVAAGGRPAGGAAREPVVPVESEPGRAGAGREPGAATAAGEGPAGSGADRGRDGIRPDGSGEREQPGVTPAPEDVIATENAVARPDESRDQSEGVSEAIYENYRPQRIQIVGAKAHPGALVQSAAMASVLPPKTDYKPRLPAALIKSGALSDAQLEAIVYAGHAHSDVMPNGKRRGFFIGDGTGVGKGREIAGILLDNKQSGRTKAVWVSEKRALLNDAKRDWNGLNQPATEILDHGKTKAGDDIAAKQGILFTTYDTLKSAEQTKTEGEKVRGRERVDQIVDWLGKDFDGVIAFDESHNLGNAVEEKGKRGTKKAALKALAGVALQDKLPNARVIYVSATGATEVGNLAYADRLGLWGEGTSFANRQDFVGKVSSGGMAAMELVARDMKALGHYIARSLSYDGVSYDRVEHVLSKDQRETYDKLAEGWQVVLQNFTKAMEDTGISDGGKTLNGKAKSAILSAFWGGHQRFFNQVITSMQMPSVIRGVEADVKAGRQAVLQLVNTMEAAQERALEKARKSGEGELEDLDMTPRDQLMQLVEKSFPVQQMESYVDDNGNLRSRPAVDSKGNPILNREAVAARDRLLDELGSIRVPDGPLEMLLNHFGTDKVAEVTGRGQRVVRKPDETGRVVTQVEKRGAQANVADSNDFQAGNKPILIFSEAGGTGRSYHAAIGSGSEDARRSHYLVQGGWRADKAVQGFGRTHRTNQASAPIFHLVTTDLQGQKRFISSIARRLGQLGALTKGERRTGDQGMFGMRDNLESTEARDGLTQFFRDVSRGEVEGVTMDVLEKEMGLKLRDEGGGLASPLPEMSQFLNRVLSLTIDRQNRVFEAFSDRMDQAIDRAAAAGTLDTGVEAYKADKISKVSEQTVYTDPRSGAETKHLHLLAQTRNHPVGFEDTLAGRNKTNGQKPDAFVQNVRSERVFAVTKAGDRTDSDGRITSQVRLTSPIDYQLADRDSVNRDNWKKLKPEEAKPLWDQQVAATPEYRNSALHLITGAVLPIWDRIGGNPKIYRLQTDTGERMLGRVIPSTLVDATLERLGAEGLKITETPGEIAEKVLGGATARLANEWTIKSSRVAGEPRLELVGPDYRHGEELARHGIFSERISYQTRYFIPTEPGAAAKAIEAITKTRPVTSLQEPADNVRFSPKQTETPEFKRWFGESKARDEQGKPLVAYHGTKEDFSTFDLARSGTATDEGWFGPGIYLAPDPKQASLIAQINPQDRSGALLPKGNVMPLYVRAENPYVTDRQSLSPDFVERLRADGHDAIFRVDYPGDKIPAEIVVFDPEQIKSAIGNRGTFDAGNPDIRMSPKLTPDERKAVERVFAGPGRTMAERYAEAKQDAGRKFVRGALDPYIGIKANDPAGYLASRLANSSAGAVRFFREGGTLRFDGDALASKDLNGGAAAFEEALGPELPRFLQWVVGNRADRLKAEDRENLLSADDIKTFKGMNKGSLEGDYTLSNGKTTRSREAAYVDALGKLDSLNKNLMELNVEAGNVKRGVADALLANPFYVPFYRVAEEDGNRSFAGGASLSSGMVKQTAWKKLMGGTNKLADPWTNWTRNAEHMIEAAMRNRTANKVLDTAETLGSVEKVTLQDYNHTMTKAEKADTVWTNVDGEKQYWRVHDPMVLSAVSALNTMPSRGVFMQVGRGFARMLRYGVTSNPIFAVRNLIRDTENSMAVSEISKNPFKNLYDGFSRQDMGNRLQNVARAVAGQELERRAFTREEADALAGGAMMRLGGWNEGVDRTTVLDTPSKLGAFGRYLSSVAGTYKEAVGIGEDVNRLALYKQLRQEGASHAFAAFSARDLQDFTLKGAWQWVRTITEITPFMNARAQGLYKIGRAASDADRSVAAAVGGRVARNLAIRTATVLGAMTLAGLALDSIYHDDEDYKKRTEYDRQTYYWFKVGDAQFRIPKGFELAALSSMAADGIEAFYDKEMTGRRLVDNFWLSLGTNLQVQAPAILQPLIDIGTNTRGTGGPIEGMGMEHLRPEDRYNQSSTLIARGVSSAINAAGRAVFHATDGPSPVQIDYLANAYGGWLATNVLGMADTVARSFSSQPVEPAKDFWSQATQGLVSTEPRAASRYVDLLYKQGKEVEQAYASYRDLLSRGQGEEAQRFFKDNQETLQKHGLVSGLMRLEGDLNRQIRLISNNPDPRVTAEQKKIQIMQLQSIKSRAAEQVFGARP